MSRYRRTFVVKICDDHCREHHAHYRATFEPPEPTRKDTMKEGNVYGARSIERADELREGNDETYIYAAGGWVIWEMTPDIADELASHILPASDPGFSDDAAELLEASFYAKGNSPKSKVMQPPEDMSINERQAWKEGMGHGLFLAAILESGGTIGSLPKCSHGHTEPHEMGGNTGFNYDVAWMCDEWESEGGLFVTPYRLKE